MRSTAPDPRPQLVEILFGAYRRQILALLLLRADESFYVREIARLTGVPAGSLHRELTLLADAGLLLRAEAGNQVRYQANHESSIFPELAGIFRKTSGLADVLRDLLAPMQSKIAFAWVFGSMAHGNAQASSDIDLMVIGTTTFANVVHACHEGSARLGREVNPVVMTRTAFKTKLQGNDRFVTRVTREPKIFVMGDAGEFAKLTEDRPN